MYASLYERTFSLVKRRRIPISRLLLLGVIASPGFAFAQSPGGIDANLRVWLKADAGFTPSSWNDYSGNDNDYTQTNAARQPFTATQKYNFNPVIDFGTTGSDARFMVVPSGKPYTANGSNSSVFTINLDRSVGGYADILGFGATTTSASLINANLPVVTRLGVNVRAYPYADASPALAAVVANKLYLNDVSYTVGTAGVKYGQNGVTGSNTQTFAAGNARHANGSVLGSQPEVRNGLIGEVIAYERDLTEAEKQRVRTYAAIKYGISLPHNYIASDGTTIVWSQTTNTGYNNNIAGLSNDNGSSLSQKQSNSINDGRQVLIATTGLADANADNTVGLSSGQFLLWGDNGLSKSPSVEITGITGISHRFAAIWKVQNTSSVGTVRVAWMKSLANLSLIQSDDATFTSADDVTNMTGNEITINGVVYNYADVTLDNGSYFTFAAKVPAPGGVATGLTQWYRADQNLTSTGGDGTNIATWTDYARGTISAQIATAPLPKYKEGATNYFNFNPGVNFTATNQMLGNIATPTLENANFDIFTLTKEGMTGTRFFNIGRNNTALSGSNWDQPGLYASGNIATRNSTGGGLGIANPGSINFATTIPSIMYHTFTNTSIRKGLNGATLGTVWNISARGLMTGGHIFGSNRGTNPPNGDDLGFVGNIGEVIVYGGGNLSATDRNKVDAYLAVKYGITLPTGISYLNSSGDTVWNATANSAYHKNVTGIALDESSALNQKQSISVNAGQSLIVGTTGLSNTNAANATSLSNDQYLMIGDNGLAQSLSTGFSYPSLTDLNLRFSAIWKVQNTGTVGTVRVAWPEGVPSIHLIQSDDATFDDTDDFTDMTPNIIVVNGITYNYADVTLANGSYFTFAGYVVGPGNVASAAWYRADAMGQQFTDAGTTASTDSSLLHQWNEYKGTGYNLVQATTGDKPVFSNAQTLANFNPTVTFSGSQFMRYTAPTGANIIDRANGSIYAAGKIKNLNNVGFAGFDNSMDYPGLHTYNVGGGDYKLLFFTGGPGYNGRSDSSFTRNRYFTIGSGWQNGDGSTATYAGGTVSLNGFRKVYSGTSDFNNVNLTTAARDFQIGQDSNHGALNGQLNEVVVFENELSEDEMDRVETYLAIKYGTTYANGTRDYVNSSSTAVWNATDNAGYISNIAGIARDNQGSINQKQSWSTNPGQQVLIGTTGLANTNAGNATGLADGQFLIWGDNGLAKNPSVAIAAIADVNYRFAAIWKAENTNSVATVRVAWPKGLSNLKLIQSADATIDATDDITDMENTQTINGVEYAYADVTLSNGQYFTFAAFIQAPGGVTNGLSHWYRADKYAQASGEGADVTAWTDFTSGVTSEQIGDVALPKMRMGDTTYFNFNPGVNFTATAQKIGNIDVQTLSSLNFDVFSATKEGMAGTRFFNIGMDNTTFNGNNWDQPGFYVNGNIARRNNTGGGLTIDNPGSIAFVNNQPSIMYHSFTDLGMSKGINGKGLGATSTHTTRGAVTGGHIFGSNAGDVSSGDDGGFIGDIGELVIYGAGSITTAERNKVDAYLAIKYGVTLDTANNYTTSQDVVVWNKSLNKGFYNNVAGIGHDYISALHQKQSRSQRTNTNGQVIMSLDALAANNAANAGSVEDGQFLLWGDNNVAQAMTATASTYTTFSYAGGTNNGRRMNRVWKVQNTDVDQSLQVIFPRSSVGTVTLPAGDACAAYAILFADDSAMTTNLVAVPLTTSEDSVQYIVSHAFPNGMSYFSFGKVTPLENGNVYLPAVAESTVEYDNNCGVGEWVNYHQTGAVSEKMFGAAGFAAADLDSLQLTITPIGANYDDGVRMTNLMPRITHVADSNTSTLPSGKVRVYYSADEMAATAVPGAVTNSWFRYDGDADAVLIDVYGDGIFETGKATELTPDASGVEDGVNYVEFHGVSSFSSFVYLSSTEEVGTVLPVSMLYFRAEKVQDQSLLTWATASEVNNSGFIIERSAEARSWKEIGFMQGNGTQSQQSDYRFVDAHPAKGDNFYRLKQLDIDGTFEYSQVQLVRFDKAHQLQIVPNPTNANFVIKGLRGNNTIAMANVAGQVLVNTRAEGVGEKTIQVSHLPAGTYFVTVVNDDGSSEVHKVVKD